MPAERLCIGIVAVESWQGGVVYTHNLVRAIRSLPAEEQPTVTLFYEQDSARFEDLLPLADAHFPYRTWFSNSGLPSPVRKLVSGLKASLRLSLMESDFQLALLGRRLGVHAMFPLFDPRHRLIPGALAWIPDLQHKALPHFFTEQELRRRDDQFGALLRQSGRTVVFSSEHARSEAIRFFGEPKARTHVLHFATVPEQAWYGDPAPVLAKYNIQREYLIVCNQFWAHKEHALLFDAIRLLTEKRREVHVVCTGPTDDYRNPGYFAGLQAQIEAGHIGHLISILGLVPRHDQVMLIKGASAVVQPSSYEGWSTVLEDARALGKPVIASDFPVHVEQAVPGAIYFRGGDVTDCARAIAELYDTKQNLSQPCDRSDHRSAHAARVQAFARSFLEIAALAQHTN
jgi:glycosyltransferase involved in cell wall biosynthesis